MSTSEIVHNRIRASLIDYCDDAIDFEADRGFWDLNDLINWWEDCVGTTHPIRRESFPEPTYSEEEFKALLAVDKAWLEFANNTPKIILDHKQAFSMPEWKSFKEALLQGREILNIQGTNDN